ncbi:MAG: hypothetical protein SGJ02_07840 [bacterium]|nr:hypothetical protein [bacterium]
MKITHTILLTKEFKDYKAAAKFVACSLAIFGFIIIILVALGDR